MTDTPLVKRLKEERRLARKEVQALKKESEIRRIAVGNLERRLAEAQDEITKLKNDAATGFRILNKDQSKYIDL